MPTHGHVARVGLWTDFSDKRHGCGLGERSNLLLGELLLENILALVEALVQNDRRLLDTLLLCQGCVASSTEQEVVPKSLCDCGKRRVRGLVICGKVADQDDLVGGLEVLECVCVDV